MPSHTVEVSRWTGITTLPYCLKVFLNLWMRLMDLSCRGSGSSCPGWSLLLFLWEAGEQSHRGPELRRVQQPRAAGASICAGRLQDAPLICSRTLAHTNRCIPNKLLLPAVYQQRNKTTVWQGPDSERKRAAKYSSQKHKVKKTNSQMAIKKIL